VKSPNPVVDAADLLDLLIELSKSTGLQRTSPTTSIHRQPEISTLCATWAEVSRTRWLSERDSDPPARPAAVCRESRLSVDRFEPLEVECGVRCDVGVAGVDGLLVGSPG